MTKKIKDKEHYVLGFDGGGTKSICVIAKEDGTVAGVGLSGVSNFQAVGVVAAGRQVRLAINKAIKQAGISRRQILTAVYGIAGADRDVDFDTVASYVLPNNPAGRMMLVNDTSIALRAGTKKGVGVAVICGTGSNCIGFNEQFEQAKVGGLGGFTGDVGGGEDIVEKAIVAALRGEDGRGKRTMLHDRLADKLELEQLEDIIELYYADDYKAPNLGNLAPIVFDCAKKGDQVAIQLLRKIGKALAHNAVTASRRLFKKDDKFSVVLGGSILQNSKPPILYDMVKAEMNKRFVNAKVIKIKIEPVLGAVFYALDILHGTAGMKRMKRVKDSYPALRVR